MQGGFPSGRSRVDPGGLCGSYHIIHLPLKPLCCVLTEIITHTMLASLHILVLRMCVLHDQPAPPPHSIPGGDRSARGPEDPAAVFVVLLALSVAMLVALVAVILIIFM